MFGVDISITEINNKFETDELPITKSPNAIWNS
jgi:hypothetical protein